MEYIINQRKKCHFDRVLSNLLVLGFCMCLFGLC